MELKPSFSNLLKCLSVFDTVRKNTIRDGGSTALFAAYTVDNVDTVYIVYTVDMVNTLVVTIDIVYTVCCILYTVCMYACMPIYSVRKG